MFRRRIHGGANRLILLFFGGTQHGPGPWPYWDTAFAAGPFDDGERLFRLCGDGHMRNHLIEWTEQFLIRRIF